MKELTEIEVEEVSIVKFPANRRKLLVVKGGENEMDQDEEDEIIVDSMMDYVNSGKATMEDIIERSLPNILTQADRDEMELDDDDGYTERLPGDKRPFHKSGCWYIEKTNKDQQIITGIVYEPDVIDGQGDIASAEEIERACYRFALNGKRKIKDSHSNEIQADILESYVTPADLNVETDDGIERITKGTWLMTIKILSSDIWNRILSGDLNGLSMAGQANS